MITSNIILLIYLIFFSIEFFFERTLSFLNFKSILRHKDSVPVFFKNWIDNKTYKSSVLYNIDKYKFGFISALFSFAFLFVLVTTGFFGAFEQLILNLNISFRFRQIIFLFSITGIFSITALPFSLYNQFKLEAKHGFNTMTARTFFTDFIKSTLVSVILLTPILLLLFWFVELTPGYWWIIGFAAISLFQVIVSVIYPIFISPLFNKFKPLEEGSLKDKLTALAQKLQFKTDGIFVMDGSKRSKHSNAYFTGLGSKKRIVLFDTLLENLDDDELAAVLAHEIGHNKKKHIVKRLILSFIMMFGIFFIVSRLLLWNDLFSAFNFSLPSLHGVLIILSFCSGPFTFMFTPLFSMWSRKHEYEADKFAVENIEDIEKYKSALIKLGKDNKSNLTPHKLFSFYHYSHPTLPERIKALSS